MWKIQPNTNLLKLISVTIGKYKLGNPLAIYTQLTIALILKFEDDSHNLDNHVFITMFILYTCIMELSYTNLALNFPWS